ncbi:10409_t:CDS:1 [Acaulospora colombiana]|uniref:10409_t:CDS:1 n=1 Tax=Acaulospora colombiana TaxID=27376 RepID=A0ACA9NAN1_9GLOM|nr:10409_t:CDS:1 [Acaulospora colombiana]
MPKIDSPSLENGDENDEKTNNFDKGTKKTRFKHKFRILISPVATSTNSFHVEHSLTTECTIPDPVAAETTTVRPSTLSSQIDIIEEHESSPHIHSSRVPSRKSCEFDTRAAAIRMALFSAGLLLTNLLVAVGTLWDVSRNKALQTGISLNDIVGSLTGVTMYLVFGKFRLSKKKLSGEW